MPTSLKLAALPACLLLPCLALLGAAGDDKPAAKAATAYFLQPTAVIDPGVVILPFVDGGKLQRHTEAYNAALKIDKPQHPANMALNLVSAGPRLDSADEVKIGTLTTKDNTLALTITYTSARVRGELLRENTQWTPLAFELLPSTLPPGNYTLTVTWQCSDTPAKGTQKPADLKLETKFELTAPK